MTDFTRTFRRAPYQAIAPTAPSRIQLGRTVMIAGGSSGIGYNITRAFAEAKAETIILLARGEQRLHETVRVLSSDFPDTRVLGLQCDLSDDAETQKVWEDLERRSIGIDVLVLNAGPPNPDKEDLRGAIAKLHVQPFFAMVAEIPNQYHNSSDPLLPPSSFYSLHGRNAGFVSYLCHISDHIPETSLRMVSLHPGCVFTEHSSRASGLPEEAAIWDDPRLSAHMAVWTTDQDNRFLHGRFLWANWDAVELVARKGEIGGNSGLLKVGVTGLANFDLPELFKKCEDNS